MLLKLKIKNYRYKSPIFSKIVDIGNVVVSHKISFGEKKSYKYFIGYLYEDYRINLLHIMLPKEVMMAKVMMAKNGCIF